jgi:acyl-CoA reductase-like NAD-dependent aldehyde dehydrogenase
VAMKIERFDVAAVDDCLDTLKAAFQSDMWRQLPEQDRRRLVNRLYIILRDIGEGSRVSSLNTG